MKPVSFGLIGYGAWGSHHARAIAQSEAARLVAVADRSAESQAAAKSAHPDIEVYADYRILLRRNDIEVVDVVLPSDLHSEVGTAALEAGKHVLMEKPLGVTVEQCRRLNDLAAGRRRLLAVGFEMRLSELWGRPKKMIDDGLLGDL